MGRADLHFHLLPGVDDGPATLDESVELALAAQRDGTDTIVATPHVRGDFVTDVRQLPELLRMVEERLDRDRIPVSLRCGAELGHDMVGRLSQAELDTVALGPPGARWLLVETPFDGVDDHLHDAADELRDRGFGVVLAHPERSAALLDDRLPDLRLELERGVLLQINAHSLTGAHGARAQVAGTRLLLDGRAELIASDAHSGVRAPALGAAARAATARGVAPAAARRLVDANPARLLSRGIAAPVAPVAA